MGQQQLLLLVLGAVIVGMAIVIGINMFGEGAHKAQEDNVKQDLVTMAAKVQEFWRKPTYMGGAGKVILTFDEFPQIGYIYNDDAAGTTIPAGGQTYTNSNGLYTIVNPGTVGDVDITGVLVDDSYTAVGGSPTFTLGLTEVGNGTHNEKLTFTITP